MIDRRNAVFNIRRELRRIQQQKPWYIMVPAVPWQGWQYIIVCYNTICMWHIVLIIVVILQYTICNGIYPGTLHSNVVHRGVHAKFRIEVFGAGCIRPTRCCWSLQGWPCCPFYSLPTPQSHSSSSTGVARSTWSCDTCCSNIFSWRALAAPSRSQGRRISTTSWRTRLQRRR